MVESLVQPCGGYFIVSCVSGKAYQASDAGLHSAPAYHPQDESPAGEDWIHEIKYDGYRVQSHIDWDSRKAFTRNGHNWISKFSAIGGTLDIPPAIIDGEVVVIHEGRTNFSELQAELAGRRQDRLLYYAFDLLWLDGKDLRRTSQLARKELLKELFDTHCVEAPALYSEHLTGDGNELFKAAAKLNYEGIVSKRVEAPYRSDRNEAWVKIKAVQKGKFPVVGFINDPTRSRRTLPGEAGREKACLHGQGRDGLVSHRLQRDP
ncbi:ATP-dependent DNA ligase [Bradyrhizobium sp. S3.9.2]|uniref:ATP-dependent DNA ligase n=1 Tax=Bradyrhizobium sp. S3.9.2 TaxID=3156432 RepID=UPI0033910A2B